MKGSFCYEINVTKLCNLACTYCFEGDSCRLTDDIKPHVNQIKSNISQLLDSEWFKDKFDGILITFWGGEPTLVPEVLMDVVETYKDNDNITYHIYTNGVDVDPIISIFEPVKSKLTVQVSYDGNPVHDMTRVFGDGKGSSVEVKNSIEKLYNKGFDVSLKSTIRPSDLKYISEVWDDIYQLNSLYGGKICYAPTIDYNNEYDETYIEDLKKSMVDVCKKEVKYFNDKGKNLLLWFDRGIEYCGFFRGGVFVDTDGRMLYCHGCGYVDDASLSFGTIYDDDFVDKIKNSCESFGCNRHDSVCETCISKICYSCNVSKYINSKKEDFMDRWYDFSCQPHLCEYFRLITKYRMALRKVIGEKNGM